MSSEKLQNAIPAYILAYSDSDFTNPHEVVLPDAPRDCRGDFTHMGAKYWGYESSRHKATQVLEDQRALYYDHDAHNWIDIGFRVRTEVDRITVSTKWFTGNQVHAISLLLTDELTGNSLEVLTRVKLNPDAEHEFRISPTLATEARVEVYYEGGISRINFFGAPAEEQLASRNNLLEGARISHVSNEHYGKPAQAVSGNRREMHMLGWESARTGFGEQVLFHLNAPATLSEIVVDTYLHRLNPPLTCHIFGLQTGADPNEAMKRAPRWKAVFLDGTEAIPDNFQAYMLEQQYLDEPVENPRRFTIMLHIPEGSPFFPVLPFARLRPDTFHRFTELESRVPVTHLLYMHYPNGGIHGLKVFAE